MAKNGRVAHPPRPPVCFRFEKKFLRQSLSWLCIPRQKSPQNVQLVSRRYLGTFTSLILNTKFSPEGGPRGKTG